MLDGLLLVIGNGLSTVPLHVLTTKAELTPKLGFENEVQDISGCRTRSTKINCPSVSFVQFQCVHLLQLWFCSHLSVIYRAQPTGFLRKNRVKIIVALDLPFIGDTPGWLRYLYVLSPID